MSGAEYGIIALVVVLATCLQASIGFGLGMLAAPVIALIDPTLLPGSLILMALVVTIAVVITERAHLDLRGAGWALIGRVPGSLAGAWLVSRLPSPALAFAVGAVVLFGVVISFVGWVPRPGRLALMTAGAASGVMGTATSIGGPPMAMVWQTSEGARLRGTMSAFFLVGSCVSLGALLTVGALPASTVQLAAWMLPALAAGFLLSRLANRFLNKSRLRLVALLASALSASVLVISQFV